MKGHTIHLRVVLPFLISFIQINSVNITKKDDDDYDDEDDV